MNADDVPTDALDSTHVPTDAVSGADVPLDAGAATTTRSAAALAGVVAAGVALAVGELIAGLVDGVASPVSAVGSYVVLWAPPALEDFAISVFGTSDKAALAIGTVIIALAIGAYAGMQARNALRRAVPWFAGFGVLGTLAGLDQALSSPLPTILTGAAAVAAGLGTLAVLQRAGRPAAATAPLQPGDPTDGRVTDPHRRRFLALAAGTGVAALTAGVVGRRLLTAAPAVTGELEAAFAATPPVPAPGGSFAVDGLTPLVVPNDRFYRIDTALLVPKVDVEDWRLRVTGMVDRELELSIDDLMALPRVDEYVTIACVSNEVGGDLVGNARWSGVRLVDVLDAAGIRNGADQIVGRSVDGWTAGFPTEVAYDGREPLIALGMNGEVLPARHGFPARLIVPGLYGYVSATKWLDEIELTTWDGFDAYWIPRGWAKEGPIKTQSRIDVPRDGARIDGPGVVVAGVAWAPTVGIERVEVRLDEDDWVDAELGEVLGAKSWVQWKTTLQAAPGQHRITVRATDGTGTTQTAAVQRPRPDGATGHHSVEVRVA